MATVKTQCPALTLLFEEFNFWQISQMAAIPDVFTSRIRRNKIRILVFHYAFTLMVIRQISVTDLGIHAMSEVHVDTLTIGP